MLSIGSYYIYDERTAKDFLYSLGLDDWDIEDLIKFLTNANNEIEELKETVEYYKSQMEGEFEQRQYLISEIQALADKLETGKGGTKKQYSQKFHALCEEYA